MEARKKFLLLFLSIFLIVCLAFLAYKYFIKPRPNLHLQVETDLLKISPRKDLTWQEGEEKLFDAFLKVVAYCLTNSSNNRYAGGNWEEVYQKIQKGGITKVELAYPVKQWREKEIVKKTIKKEVDLKKPVKVVYTSVSAPEGELEEGMPDLERAPYTALGSGLSFCIIEVEDGQLIVKLYGNPYPRGNGSFNPRALKTNLVGSWINFFNYLYYGLEGSHHRLTKEAEELGLDDLFFLPGDEPGPGVPLNPVFAVEWPNKRNYVN